MTHRCFACRHENIWSRRFGGEAEIFEPKCPLMRPQPHWKVRRHVSICQTNNLQSGKKTYTVNSKQKHISSSSEYLFRVLQLFLLGILRNGVIFPWKSPVKESPQRFTSPTKTVFLFKQFSRLEFWGFCTSRWAQKHPKTIVFFCRGKNNSTFWGEITHS